MLVLFEDLGYTFFVFFFFFSSRRRHTRLQGDWSSDVCSSDLCNSIEHPWRRSNAVAGARHPRESKAAAGDTGAGAHPGRTISQAAVGAANPPADPTACATATHADRACCCRAGCPWGYAVSTDTPTSPAHADRGVIGRVCGPPGNSGSSTPETAGPCAGTVSPWKAARWFPTIGPALPALSVKDARSASWLCDARRSHPLGDGPGIFLINVLRADLDIE